MSSSLFPQIISIVFFYFYLLQSVFLTSFIYYLSLLEVSLSSYFHYSPHIRFLFFSSMTFPQTLLITFIFSRVYILSFFSTSMMPSFFNGRFLTIPSVLPFSSHSPNFACSHIPFRFHSSIKWDYFTCNQPFLQALSLPTLSFTRFPSLDCSTKLGSWPIFFALSEIHIIDQKEKNK